MRNYTPFDDLIIGFDHAVRTLFGHPPGTERADPAEAVPEAELSEAEREETVRLLRIDHTGEVCAQALYQGQALSAHRERVRESMERAAREENDHLAWCERRVEQLGGRLSYLNPVWYAGSFAIGALAGLAGDRWSLGFVAETERQVVKHLDGHLERLPVADARSRAILEQMRSDEATHATTALHAGGESLPWPIPEMMRTASRVMTGTTYYI